MANTFKNYAAKNVGTSPVAVLTGAVLATTCIGMTVANTSASAVYVDVYLTISGVDYYLVKGAPIAIGQSFVPIGGDQKVVIENGDALKVVSSVASSVDVILSVLESTT